MSRLALCILTASLLSVLSLSVMATRYGVMGGEVPAGPNTWKVTMLVQGEATGDARVLTLSPLDFGHQHVIRELYTSEKYQTKPTANHQSDRRHVIWYKRSGAPDGAFKLRGEFQIALEVLHPSSSMTRLARGLYAAPKPGEYLDAESRAGADSEKITAQARHLTSGIENRADMARALFDYVAQEVRTDPSIDAPAVNAAECLKNESGDCAAKARLLAALLRNRDIPARLVVGLPLTHGHEQRAHYWVEAWLDRWVPMCPVTKHYGHVPPTFLTLGFGDQSVAKGNKHVKDLDYGFLVERTGAAELNQAQGSPWRRFFLAVSLYNLPPSEQKLVEFLLLLPVAALIICIYRNLIGVNSFGTFAPALVGLAFRELHNLPGILVFMSILLVGWVMRRVLDHYHLLQVPRIALMLSLIVVVLLVIILVANSQDQSATRYFPLFPMIILTGMVERFWTLETEDSTTTSFKTLLNTMLIAGSIALVLSLSRIVHFLFHYPETLGLIMAVQLLIGRYTGYRLMELFRFRDFITTPPKGGNGPHLQVIRS
jgi:hypothetical protein